MTSLDLSKKSLIFITGASRGIGRSIAIEFSRISNPNSSFVLIASTAAALEETKSMIKAINIDLNVTTYPLDLSNPSHEEYEKIFDKILKKLDTTELCNAIFIHNAATIGVLKQTLDLTDVNVWEKYYALNVTSAIILNINFVRKTKNLAGKLYVIHISSSNAAIPYINMSMYASGKAAREIFFKVFSLEEPNIVVLNYWPGPVDTDMFHTLVETAENKEMRKSMKKMKDEIMLKPEQTVGKLLDFLRTGNFKSGDTVRYFEGI